MPRRRPRGEDGAADGQEGDRGRHGPEDPAGRHLDRRLQVLRPEGGAGDEGAHGHSQSFTETDKCKTVAENQLGQGAQVLFQVAGGCGLGTLKAADEAGKWGIGVDVDQYKLAKRVLTSAVKRVDTGVYDAIQQVKQGKWNGGHDLLFNLKNGGMGVGKINPAVPQSDITLMNQYRQKIISGSLKVPTT